MKIIGTGLSGLIGSRLQELMPEFEFEDLSRKNGVDIQDKKILLERLQASSAPIVLHLAAFTSVDGAEKEKDLKEESTAWKMNVLGTQNVVEACSETGKKLIHISTDMVFGGEKPYGEAYTEEEQTNPVGWYATTKAEAEKIVEHSSIPWVILRIAYPYRANFEKKEYVRIFKGLLENGTQIKAVTDHYFTPTFIDDIPHVLQVIFKEDLLGKFHATGPQSVSPYEVAMQVANVFNLDKTLISPTTRAEYFAGKAPRAFNLALSSDKIEKHHVHMHSFVEGLEEVKKQLQ